MNFLAHRARIAHDASSPVEHTCAFGRKSLKPRAAIDEQYSERVLKLLHARRQSRLGYPAGLGRPPEMFFPRQRQEKFEFFDQHKSKLKSIKGRSPPRAGIGTNPRIFDVLSVCRGQI